MGGDVSTTQLATAIKPTAHVASATIAAARQPEPRGPGELPEENAEEPRFTWSTERGPFTPEQWQEMVSEAAYYCAERRGFEEGYELDDWLEAEAEIRESIGLIL